MEQTLFGVREGADVRNWIERGMKRWQKQRKGREIKLGHSVYPLSQAFQRDNNKRLKNYRPLKVNFSRDDEDHLGPSL